MSLWHYTNNLKGTNEGIGYQNIPILHGELVFETEMKVWMAGLKFIVVVIRPIVNVEAFVIEKTSREGTVIELSEQNLH